MIPYYYVLPYKKQYESTKAHSISKNLFESGLLYKNSNIKETRIDINTEKYILKKHIQEKMRGFILNKNKKITVIGLTTTRL